MHHLRGEVSPNGQWLTYERSASMLRSDEIWVVPLDGGAKAAEAKPQPFLDTQFRHGGLQFSPDGKWVAYESDETGRNEIYLVPYPGPGGKSQVSAEGGAQPRWNRSPKPFPLRGHYAQGPKAVWRKDPTHSPAARSATF